MVGGDELLPLHVLVVRHGHSRHALADLLARRDALLQLRALDLRLLPVTAWSGVSARTLASFGTFCGRVLKRACQLVNNRRAQRRWLVMLGSANHSRS